MARIVLTFGIIAGLIVSLLMVIGMTLLAGPDGVGSETAGYLTMLLALAFILVNFILVNFILLTSSS